MDTEKNRKKHEQKERRAEEQRRSPGTPMAVRDRNQLRKSGKGTTSLFGEKALITDKATPAVAGTKIKKWCMRRGLACTE